MGRTLHRLDQTKRIQPTNHQTMKRVITLITVLLALSLHAADDGSAVLPVELPDGPKTLMLHRYLLKHANEALDRREKAFEKIKTAEARVLSYPSLRSVIFLKSSQHFWPKRNWLV